MKKIRMLLAGLFCCAATGLFFSSCSNNDLDAIQLTVNDDKTEVTINRIGGELRIPVMASGKWTATIDTDCDWADVWTKEGNGNGTIVVNTDYFSPADQKQDRQATITVINGDSQQQLTLRQYIGITEDETVANDADAPYFDLWHNKGVGYGVRPETGKFKSSILNPRGMKKVMSKRPEYSTLFIQTPNTSLKDDAVLKDTLENYDRKLAVHCTVNVKYAQFKLNIKVDYQNGGKQVNNVKRYTASQDLVHMSSNVSLADIRAIIEDNPTFDPALDDSAALSVVSTGFKRTYMEINKAYDANNDTRFNALVKRMLEDYGGVIVDGATLGGSIFTAVEYDSLAYGDSLIAGGKLAAAVPLSAINISANVDVKYTNLGQSIWQNSHHYCVVSGGDELATSALNEAMKGNFIDKDKYLKAVDTWKQSIIKSHDSKDNTALIDMTYTPIWNLFPIDVAEKMKPIVVEYYKKKNSFTIDFEKMGFLEDDGV